MVSVANIKRVPVPKPFLFGMVSVPDLCILKLMS
jgi:hypothetical protein